MKTEKPSSEQTLYMEQFLYTIKSKSDSLTNYFLLSYFGIGLLLASYYDTWQIAFGVGGLSILAYYSAKFILPESNFYQYVLSAVFGIFMAQFIYQMHGMFEMHFMAFIGSALLITYQNWKLQFPITLVVVIHHALFAYLQYIGVEEIFFTQLDYMTLQTFIIHAVLAAIIFFICGLWAYQFHKLSEKYIKETFSMGELKQKAVENEELKKTNSELDKFVYSVSHDLRAPLSSMVGVIEIAEDDTSDELMHDHLKRLKGNIKKLDGFVGDILDYSRNSRTEVRKEEINFKELISGITENLKFMGGGNREVTIKMEVNSTIPVLSDKHRLTVILGNLVSNAIRYQNTQIPNPFVDIKVDTSDTETGIIISDNGIGIRKDLHDKIFDMFYRVSDASVGSGLGLYIVKEAVTRLSGNIEVKSEIGRGSTFIIKIPNN